ncbi:lachesin-like isoform X1 [Limulus polyphemus]|uniref:Lachesin-like isoform X1 n=1 Tax=Limulus polyphemus TaxID=6850 RepID=A0ABM1SYJ2_LIMPO|nr:lachesin-like isoform X1 [Limulus polyphemus]
MGRLFSYLNIVTCYLLLIFGTVVQEHIGDVILEPEFTEPIPNVTVAIGHDAAIPCVVENLGFYRVAWLRVESKTILTIHHHVITRNYRVNLDYSDHITWILQIKNVQESDRGFYMCQINTVPMKSQTGYLDVVVPPMIIDRESSSDELVREGFNITLSCRAKGYPTPTVTWRREDGQPISAGNWQNKKNLGKTYEGMELSIRRVSRLHMGAFLCVASNGVQPSISKRILLQVHFPPMIWIPNQLVGSPIGGNVQIDCHTEAFPASINYWTKKKGEMIVDSQKYTVKKEEETYRVHMILIINNVEPEDFGLFHCFAKNSLGSTEGTIRLYEIHVSPLEHASTSRIGDEEDLRKQTDRNQDISARETAKRLQGGNFIWPNESETKEQGTIVSPNPQNFPDKQNRCSRLQIDLTCHLCFGFLLFNAFLTSQRLFFLSTSR